jgi:hypothetical protein
VRLGGEFQINNVNYYNHRYPSIGMDGDGDFVVAWSTFDLEDYGITGRRFDSSGNSLGPRSRAIRRR